MSNAKRIRKKVAKLKKRKYSKLRFVIQIDTHALKQSVRRFQKALLEIQESMKNLNYKHEQL